MNLLDNILFEMRNFQKKYSVIPNTIIVNKKMLLNELKEHIRLIPSESEVNKFADMDIIDIPLIKKYIICLRLKEGE